MFNTIKTRAKGAVVSAQLAVSSLFLVPVSATTISPTSLDTNAENTDVLVSNVLGIILKVATFIGAAMLVWGMVMFGLAIKNDEPESKQKALMTVFAGVILIGIRALLITAGILQDGTSGTSV